MLMSKPPRGRSPICHTDFEDEDRESLFKSYYRPTERKKVIETIEITQV